MGLILSSAYPITGVVFLISSIALERCEIELGDVRLFVAGILDCSQWNAPTMVCLVYIKEEFLEQFMWIMLDEGELS